MFTTIDAADNMRALWLVPKGVPGSEHPWVGDDLTTKDGWDRMYAVCYGKGDKFWETLGPLGSPSSGATAAAAP